MECYACLNPTSFPDVTVIERLIAVNRSKEPCLLFHTECLKCILTWSVSLNYLDDKVIPLCLSLSLFSLSCSLSLALHLREISETPKNNHRQKNPSAFAWLRHSFPSSAPPLPCLTFLWFPVSFFQLPGKVNHSMTLGLELIWAWHVESWACICFPALHILLWSKSYRDFICQCCGNARPLAGCCSQTRKPVMRYPANDTQQDVGKSRAPKMMTVLNQCYTFLLLSSQIPLRKHHRESSM